MIMEMNIVTIMINIKMVTMIKVMIKINISNVECHNTNYDYNEYHLTNNNYHGNNHHSSSR